MANFSSYGGSVQATVLPSEGIILPSNVLLDLVPKYFELMNKWRGPSRAGTVHDFNST